MKTVGSLFSGIGGLDLGLERAGWTVVWQAETDKYASKVLKKHWPDVPNLGDVTQIDWSDVRRPDLVCGGFPCQPVSYAGARKGDTDERWLWPEVARCLRVLRPGWALLENVPGLLTLGFGEVATDLANLGYGFRWDVLPASAFGAPHARARLFLVAHPAGAGLEGRVFSSPPWETQRQLPSGFGRAGTGWPDPPDVSGVGYGLPDWVDRLRCLGNAVVPQVAQLVAAMWLP